MTKLEKATLKLLKNNIALKKKEKITIVTDRKKCPIFNALCNASKKLNGTLTKIHITKNRNHSSPLPHLKKIFEQSNVIIAVTDKSISHSPETRIARKLRGTRIVSMVEVNKNLFLKAMKANQKKIKKIGKRLLKLLKNSKKIKIITKSGTNMVINTEGKEFKTEDGNATQPGKLINLPYGETGIAPVDTANGSLSIDFSRIGIKPKDKTLVHIKNGKITNCNKKGKKLVDYLIKAGGKKALRIVEFSIGINPQHKKPINIIIHDEKIFGTAHIGFGGFGNKRKCPIHEDIIILKPSIFADNKLIMKKGKLK